MRYNRKSYFRYSFEEPLAALFQITVIEGELVHTSEGEAQIIDISPEGARLHSSLHIPETDHKSIGLSISFELYNEVFQFDGLIVWSKQMAKTTDYGIEFVSDESMKEKLVEQLKVYSKYEKTHNSIGGIR